MRAFIHRMRYSYARYFTTEIRKIGYDTPTRAYLDFTDFIHKIASTTRFYTPHALFIYNTCVIHTSHVSFIYRTWSKCVSV